MAVPRLSISDQREMPLVQISGLYFSKVELGVLIPQPAPSVVGRTMVAPLDTLRQLPRAGWRVSQGTHLWTLRLIRLCGVLTWCLLGIVMVDLSLVREKNGIRWTITTSLSLCMLSTSLYMMLSSASHEITCNSLSRTRLFATMAWRFVKPLLRLCSPIMDLIKLQKWSSLANLPEVRFDSCYTIITF